MFEEKLIQEVARNDCLWNKQNVDYKNKRKKDTSWSTISRAVGETEENCRKRWKTLRDRFVIEMATKNRAIENAVKPNSRKDWPYYDSMLFLKACVATKGDDVSPTEFKRRQQQQGGKQSVNKQNNADAYKSWDKVSTHSNSNGAVPLPSPNTSSSPSNGPVGLAKDTQHSLSLEETVRTLVDNYMNFINTHRQSSDPFLAVIEEFFQKAPKEKRMSFKMDILNYAHKKFAEINE